MDDKRDEMLRRKIGHSSSGHLLEYASQLERIEQDIRHRVESRSRRRASGEAHQRDLVLEHLMWLLARVSAKRNAAAARIA